MRNKNLGRLRNESDRHKILLRIIRKFPVKADIDRYWSHIAHDQGVTVRLSFGADLRPDGAIRARSRINEDLLTKRGRQFLPYYSGQYVDRASRWTGPGPGSTCT